MSKLTEIAENLKKELLEDVHKAQKFFKNLSLVNAVLLILITAGTGVFVIKQIKFNSIISTTATKQESNIDLLLKNVQIMNEPAVLLKIIREKAPNLPAETQCRAADAIFRVSSARNVPLAIACAIPEIESSFDPFTPDSEVGAVGWYQVMPETAKPYMNLMLGGYSHDRLKDPVTNAICGINVWADRRDAALERGLSVEQSIIVACGHYNWGEKIGNDHFAKSILNQMKNYEERFQTSLKELRKD